VILRDYQHHAVQATLEAWKEHDSTLIVLPTGGGKTITFADIIRRAFPRKALVIAHRAELIHQAKDKIERVTGYRVEVEMADQRADLSGGLFSDVQVVVSTIQTQTAGGDGGGRMGRFDPAMFGVLVIDEAHHATAATYRRVMDYYRANPRLKILGVTATPDRADEEALGQVFQSVAYDYEILDAINDGWLVPIEQQVVEIEGLDFSAIRTTAGDLNGADLAKVMEAEKPLHGIADATVKIAGDRRTLVFAASVHQAEMLSDIFNRHRPGSAGWVCGKTPKDERAKLLADFGAGRIKYVVNVGVLTEGFDDPGVELIVMGRPTKSRALYAQMCGRALRPLAGVVDEADDSPDHRRAAIGSSLKPSCLIVDFAGNAGRHKLMSTADILGGNVSEETVKIAASIARKAGKPMRMDELLEEAEQERLAEIEAAKQREAARKARLVAKASFTTQSVNPFDVFHIRPAAVRGWDRGKPVSEKMRGLIEKHYPGVNTDELNHAQARQLCNELFRRWDGNLATFKQVRLLAKHGIDAASMSMADASAAIDALAKNGWRRVA
jgi:superfamily II DNA or RNA helicase